MTGKKAFQEKLAALDALRECGRDTQIESLRQGLANKNNFVVAKAADLAREFSLRELTSDLMKAFDRFFANPEKSDPQCWAKNAISRALAAFELQEPDVFLRGMRHHQLEPVWGGRSDTAGTLRATCALALVQCRSLTDPQLLAFLIDLCTDKDKTVRVEAMHAIEQVGSPSASLPLRLRASLGNDEPEVLGACYGGVLRLEGISAIPWVSGFLATQDDAAAEAALAIAGTHAPEGFDALRAALGTASDAWFRAVLLSAIALTRQDAALQFLLDLVRTESPDAERAVEALTRSGPSAETVSKIKELVAPNPRLSRFFATLTDSR